MEELEITYAAYEQAMFDEDPLEFQIAELKWSNDHNRNPEDPIDHLVFTLAYTLNAIAH